MLRTYSPLLALTAGLSCRTPARAVRSNSYSSSPRAIVISFDGLSEQRLREYSDSLTAPHLWSMFHTGVCAEAVRPGFPSTTPVSHASIWTGAYPNVTGISASANGAYPHWGTTILDRTDGYSSEVLRAEPIWISAARQGKRVFSQMATQAPDAPGYPPVNQPEARLDSARERARLTLLRQNVAAVNTYNELISNWRMIRSASDLSFPLGKEGDSLHARVQDDSTVVVYANHDVRDSVVIRAAPVERAMPRGRPLARFFSEPLKVELVRGRRTHVFFRLFELSPDRSRIALLVSEARVIHANRQKIADAYDAFVRGSPGNSASRLLESGALGPRVPNGGDGTAELRYLESEELLTRQFMRGTEWGFANMQPELATDYLPYPDEALHTFLGYADPSTPNVSEVARKNAAESLRRAYAIIDVRLEQLIRLSGEPGERLFVTGEHGMRPAWMTFKPNVALREAGIVGVNSAGRIDLARTQAAFTAGAWVAVNRRTRKQGIVPEDSVDAVLTRVENVLRGLRDANGKPIITGFWRTRSVAGDSLGIGGPGGGDMYIGLAPGYYWSANASGDLVDAMDFPQGEHGFPSIERDMQPLLCEVGSGVQPQRIGMVRTIDIAPTISAWLGIAPPADARGQIISEMVRH